MSAIGTLRENSLHAALKQLLSGEGDRNEVLLEGYYIDILKANGDLVEIQTRGFSNMKEKLRRLIDQYHIRIVYPIPAEKWIIHLENDLSTPISRRKSPRKGRLEDIFYELTSFPALLHHSNLTIEILMTRQEELLCRAEAPGGSTRKTSWRRRGWQVYDRKLIDILGRWEINQPADFLGIFPAGLAFPFTTKEASAALHLSMPLAQRMIYCLRQMQVLQPAGKRSRSILYAYGPQNGSSR
jgi:hypothetical protein